MAITKVTRGLLSTGIDDNSNATAITIGSDESVDFAKGIVVQGSGTTAGVYLNGTNSDTATQGNFVRYGTNFATQSNAANDTLITKTFNGSTFVDGLSVTSSGNVGILSTPVTAPLTISDKATFSFNVNDVAYGNNLYYDSQVNDRWERLSGNAGGAYYQTAGAHIWYRTSAGGATGDAVTPTESMRITNAGEVGIGITPTSGRNLHIYSSTQDALKVEVATAVNQIELKNNSGSPTYITQDSFGLQIKADENGFGGTASFFSVKVKATERFKIDAAGDTFTNDGTVSSLSDERIKTDINNLADGLDIVKQLRPVTFKYNDTTVDKDGKKGMGAADDTVRYGFIAQEVEKVAPQYVETSTRKINNVEVDDFKSLSTTRMIPMLFKAIQEQQTIIDDLKTRIETLENA